MSQEPPEEDPSVVRRSTRSSWTFGEWIQPIIAIPVSFDLNSAIKCALRIQAREDQLNDTLDCPPVLDSDDSASLSPLSSPWSSPSPPSTRPSTPSCDPIPVQDPLPPSNLQSSPRLPSKKPTRRGKKRKGKCAQEKPPTHHNAPSSCHNSHDAAGCKRKKSKKHSHENRRGKRVKVRDPTTYEARPATSWRILEEAVPRRVDIDVMTIAGSSSGYVSKEGSNGSKGSKGAYTLQEVLDLGFDHFEWDASYSAPLVDKQGHIIGACLENPPDADWPAAQDALAQGFEAAREDLHLDAEQKSHR
ncbi:hypothetical protein D9758_017827 [Tetrapyrgos nigripes]|uniref:Uncharacterized protein n=1 Tax=Tetrapyrgos nigripes TaxID=182062 RepID=A0A8H5FG97_9AGAR|nr:hypothetical protein D9758_017827 [Tetrapyrgos nigripes]